MTSTLLNQVLLKGQSNTRPSYFDGIDFDIWKNKMKAFLRSMNPLQWDVAQNGVNVSMSSRAVVTMVIDESRDSNEKRTTSTPQPTMYYLLFNISVFLAKTCREYAIES